MLPRKAERKRKRKRKACARSTNRPTFSFAVLLSDTRTHAHVLAARLSLCPPGASQFLPSFRLSRRTPSSRHAAHQPQETTQRRKEERIATKRMKGKKKMTKKTMVSSVTALVLLLLVSWAAVQARQVLNNSDMDGCAIPSGGSVLLNWSGTAICGPGGNTLPCSFSIGSILPGGPTPDPGFCAAFWQPGFSAYSQTLALTPVTEAPGLYAFEAYLGCYGGGACTFSLTIDSQSITLSGTTTKPAARPDTYTPVTATGISITNPAAVVSIRCVVTGTAFCTVTQATLTQQGGVIGDPHFVGLDGQRFDIQGQAGSAYSLLSDIDLQVCVFPLSYLLSPSFSAICWIKRHTQ